MVAFQSLGELSSWAASRGGVEFVDPGVPLTEFATSQVPLDALRKHPSVRKVTGFIARVVSTVPLHVYERTSDTDRARVTDHPLARAMTEPAPRVTAQRFLREVMMDQLLFDKFLVVWTTGAAGELTLTRVPARKVTFVGDGLGVVEQIKVSTERGDVEMPLERCIWDFGYSPVGVNGLSPLVTLADVLAESAEAVNYRREVWKNGARVSSVIERPLEAKWSDESARRFREDIGRFRGGQDRSGGYLVLEDGMKMSPLPAFNPKETLDLEGRKLSDVDVAAAFWVPPELVGAREGTYSNIEAFRQMLYGDVAGPWIGGIEQAFNVHLTPHHAGDRPLYIEANVEAKLRGSFEEQSRVLQASVGGPWLTRNEARARQNLPGIDGGDELITPLNVTEGGQGSPQDSAPTDPTT